MVMRATVVCLIVLCVTNGVHGRLLQTKSHNTVSVSTSASAHSSSGQISVEAWDNGRTSRAVIGDADTVGHSADKYQPIDEVVSKDVNAEIEPLADLSRPVDPVAPEDINMQVEPLPDLSKSTKETVSEDQQEQRNQDAQSSRQDEPPAQEIPEATNPVQGDQVNDADLQAVLTTHNSFRARYGVPPLSWSTKIAASAQSYSEHCVFEHSETEGLGENLSWNYRNWPAAIRAWMEDEEGLYDFNNPGFSHETGHFSQVVWRATTEVGCGMSNCGGEPLYVCQYAPPGNIIGQFEENVPRPTS